MRRAFVSLAFALSGLFIGAGCNWGRSPDFEAVFLRNVVPPALEAFRRDVGRYPTQDEGFAALFAAPQAIKNRWHGPYLAGEKMPPDPWLHDYVYRCPSQKRGKSYDLVCRGPTDTEDYYVFSR